MRLGVDLLRQPVLWLAVLWAVLWAALRVLGLVRGLAVLWAADSMINFSPPALTVSKTVSLQSAMAHCLLLGVKALALDTMLTTLLLAATTTQAFAQWK
jgi:hypothetical protein